MKTKLVITFLFIVFLTGTLFALSRERKIGSAIDFAHLDLTKSLYSQTLGMDATSKRLVYVSYVSGFVDAMEMSAVDSGVAKKFIQDCEGLTAGDLIDTMYNFKDQNPQWRDLEPATVLTNIVPRLKKGLLPFPDGDKHLLQ
ncbi:MAG: hypothetical protein WC330_04440 [Candidatus Omnitrophota bacterium]